MKRFDDAELTLQRAIDVCKNTLGGNHPDYAVILKNYSVVLRMLGRKREAKKFQTQGQQIEQASNRRNGVGSTISVTSLRYRGNLTSARAVTHLIRGFYDSTRK
jgi:hypothetical protein